MGGFVLIDRSLLNHHIVGVSNKDRMAVWLTILCAASWKERKIYVGGKEVTLQRGEAFFSIRNLSKTASVSRRVTERILTRLKSVTMIETRTVTGGTVISICNYDKYQDIENYRGQDRGQDTGQDGDRTVTGRGQDGDIKEYQNNTRIIPEGINATLHSAGACEKNSDSSEFGSDELFELEHALRQASDLVNDPSPDLMVMSEPMSWLNHGCDLKLDILPVLESRRKSGIRSWAYFRQAVFEARDRRTAAPPNTDTVTDKKTEANASTKKSSKGFRLPDDWQVTPDLISFAIAEGLNFHLAHREADKFRDYWHSATGANATKKRWDLAFRNWVRIAADRLPSGQGKISNTEKNLDMILEVANELSDH